jgi:hypothetical protein
MQDDATPRGLQERTAKHYCVLCLAQIPAEEYFRNDFLCDRCAAKDEYPLASTPDVPKPGKKK